MKKVLVINPNSNKTVTHGLQECLAPLQIAEQIEIECMTLANGPFEIASSQDIQSVVSPLQQLILEREDADAYVLACYSDPGLAVCREASQKPVFGIQESGLFTALQRGVRLGVVALSPKSIARHLPYIRSLGLQSQLANERPLNLSVAESEEAAAFPRITAVARELVEQDKADTLLMGCAGMSRHCEALENELGVPVTEPTHAATVQAVESVLKQEA